MLLALYHCVPALAGREDKKLVPHSPTMKFKGVSRTGVDATPRTTFQLCPSCYVIACEK